MKTSVERMYRHVLFSLTKSNLSSEGFTFRIRVGTEGVMVDHFFP